MLGLQMGEILPPFFMRCAKKDLFQKHLAIVLTLRWHYIIIKKWK